MRPRTPNLLPCTESPFLSRMHTAPTSCHPLTQNMNTRATTTAAAWRTAHSDRCPVSHQRPSSCPAESGVIIMFQSNYFCCCTSQDAASPIASTTDSASGQLSDPSLLNRMVPFVPTTSKAPVRPGPDGLPSTTTLRNVPTHQGVNAYSMASARAVNLVVWGGGG